MLWGKIVGKKIYSMGIFHVFSQARQESLII